MTTRGTRELDPTAQTVQVDWLVLPIRQCPDDCAERRVIASHFRVAHEPWMPLHAYVQPVEVRRTRTRVLFRQMSGRQF